MIKKLRNLFDVLSTNVVNTYDPKSDCLSKSITSGVFCIATFILMIINYLAGEVLMCRCSLILTVGFFISFIVAHIFKKANISSGIITILVAFILSVFALSGGNEGFAILWILLVPIISVNLLGIKDGITISTYFLLFITFIFLTPYKINMLNKYSISFISRFPILYACDYVISIFLILQKAYYHKQTIIKSYCDELTGCYNRRYFMEHLNNNKYNCVVLVDVNGLKGVNDNIGHLAGDELIKSIPNILKTVFDKNSIISRIGGDEFTILTNLNEEELKNKIKLSKQLASEYKGELINNVSFSAGYCYTNNDINIEKAFTIADEKMYEDKEEYYKTHPKR